MNNNEDTEEINNDTNVIDKRIYNNESNDDFNDEDNRIDINIVFDSENKEKGINNIYEKLLQDKMTDHYLHKYHVKITPLMSSYIKVTSKTWRSNYYLNIEKCIHFFVRIMMVSLTSINGRMITLMKEFIQFVQNQMI